MFQVVRAYRNTLNARVLNGSTKNSINALRQNSHSRRVHVLGANVSRNLRANELSCRNRRVTIKTSTYRALFTFVSRYGLLLTTQRRSHRINASNVNTDCSSFRVSRCLGFSTLFSSGNVLSTLIIRVCGLTRLFCNTVLRGVI